MSCLSFVRGEGHTLWLEGSHPFCEVLSLSATGGLLSLRSEKREGVPRRNNTPRGNGCLELRDTSAAELEEGLALGDLRRCHRCAGEILPYPLGRAAARLLSPGLVVADCDRGELVA